MFQIKQSTAITVPFFAYDSNGDGVTGVADGSWTKRISKNGAAFGAMTVTISEMENGWYSIPLSTSHTDTLGFLAVSLSATGVKRVNLLWNVSARIFDDLAYPNTSGRGIDVDASGGVEITANQNVNVNQWLTATPNALISGRVDSNVQAMANDVITAASLAADAGGEIADAVWDEDATGHQTQGTFGQAIGDPGADTDTIWGLANTSLDATVSSRASQTSVNTIDDFVDTEIAAIISTLGTPAGASISADLLTIDNLVDDLESRLGTPSNLGSGATVAANLVDIEGQTDDIGAAGAGLTAVPWNAAWDAEVQSEVQDAIEVNNLDHLVKIAVDTDFPTTVHLNSVVGYLADNGTSATYDRTTDSLEAQQAEHDTTQSAIAALNNISAADVWAAATRTLTAFAFSVTVGTNNDKTGYRLSATGIQDIWDALTAALTTAGSIGKLLVDNVNTTISSRSSHAAADVWAVADRQLTAISAALRNSIADNVLRRSLATAISSSDGDTLGGRSLIGAIARLVNRSAISGNTLTVYRTDDTTALYTQTLTTDGSADPVVEADTD